jgi:hypothetical protein
MVWASAAMVPPSAINLPSLSTEPWGRVTRALRPSPLGAVETINLFAGIKADAPGRGGDRAVIFNIAGNQESRPAAGNIDLAVVDDFGRRGRGIKFPGPAAGQLGGGGGRGGQNQPVNTDGGLATNVKAGLVLQDDITVGVQIPQNLRGAAAAMLFQTMEEAEGSTKVVVSPALILKLFQLMNVLAGSGDGFLGTRSVERGRSLGDRANAGIGIGRQPATLTDQP